MVCITSAPTWEGPVNIEPVRPGQDGGTAPAPRNLLIIEDDPTMRLAMACMVADEGWQVVLAGSAEEAIASLAVVEPDVIVCDYVLQGMTGREFCERLKGSPRWRHVPVLMVTRLDEPSIIRDLLRSGAHDVMVKPVRGGELRARVQAGLRGREGAGRANPFTAPVKTVNAVTPRLLDVRA